MDGEEIPASTFNIFILPSMGQSVSVPTLYKENKLPPPPPPRLRMFCFRFKLSNYRLKQRLLSQTYLDLSRLEKQTD